jgi:hypothetical protein
VAEKFQSVISAENKENIGESVSKIVGQVLDELKTIELSGGDQVSPSLYFSRIIENKNPDIKISRLSFDLVSSKNIELLVGGVSKNREGLVTFIEDLKSKAGFKNIEMPVSEFAKDSDVPFTLHIDIIL